MKTKHCRVTGVIALGLLFCHLAFAPVFIKFDGVDGESKDAGHVGWSDAESVDMSTSKEIGPDGNPTGNVRVDKFCITKRMDKASPLLFKASVGDETYPKVTIEFTRDLPPGDECRVQVKYELTDATVLSYKTNANRDNPPGTDEVCLSFGTLTVTYYPCSEDGTPGDPIAVTYTRR